jgi:hypothetical protein
MAYYSNLLHPVQITHIYNFVQKNDIIDIQLVISTSTMTSLSAIHKQAERICLALQGMWKVLNSGKMV